jgi:helix-turn-helix family protein
VLKFQQGDGFVEKKEFGIRLKMLRKERGLTQQDLVNVINNLYGTEINRTTISKWENGTQEASIRFAKIFANFFNVSLDFLNGVEDLKKPTTNASSELFDKFLNLDPKNLQKVSDYLDLLLLQQNQEKEHHE